MATEQRAEPVVHECCGCSCYVCANGHDMSEAKVHTVECMDRFYAEQASRHDESGPVVSRQPSEVVPEPIGPDRSAS